MRKVHQMAGFFHVWNKPALWCHFPSLDTAINSQYITSRLSVVAFKRLCALEEDILQDIGKLVMHPFRRRSQEKMELWVSLWQLILLYREVMLTTESMLTSMDLSSRDPGTGGNSFLLHVLNQCSDVLTVEKDSLRTYYLKLTTFFHTITTCYHYSFRTKKSLEISVDWLETSGLSGQTYANIEIAANKLSQARKPFRKS